MALARVVMNQIEQIGNKILRVTRDYQSEGPR